MGVPKFFRWVAERYPTVITPFKDSPPPIDNLYLDANGIIHNCTHPNDVDAARRAPTEREMVEAIFAYLDKLFQAVQPRKHFMLAIDGVAPRAKMNQQRQRRYRSGYEMMVAREEALKRGEELPDEGDVFDSNCITPGTEFMVRLSEHIKYFIAMRVATDSAWQNVKVIYSGHDHPGEGEHKIVDFIRRRKSQPDYDPTETHCMYGLDADLIMLALATHEPRFVLLREVVSFGTPGDKSRKDRERREEDEARGIKEDASFGKADEFVLFHINVLREYLDLDIRARLGAARLPLDYNFERVVDDFVFMCVFIGNDFLPALPTLAINDGGMLTMLQIYTEHVLARGAYMTKSDTKPNWNSVEIFLSKIGDMELDVLRARQEEEQEYARRASRRGGGDHEVNRTAVVPISSIVEYKQRFYREKHGFEAGWVPKSADMDALRRHYMEGLLWVLGYYYQGPASWKWFYPHHYAPLASDLVNLSAIASMVRFDKGQPFLPHQQLLAVLPPMSYRSIPRAYWPLLRSKASPLHRFFPEHLEIDREGARAPWEGIVLIPFIDEKVLLAAYASVQQDVTPEDAAKNRLGKPLLYQFDSTVVPFTVTSAMFRSVPNATVAVTEYDFPLLAGAFVPQVLPGCRVGSLEHEGFASLNSKLRFATPVYEVGATTVFGMPTRKESLILDIDQVPRADSVEDVYTLVGSEIFVGYPHYKRARVSSVSDRRRTLVAQWSTDGKLAGTATRDLTGEEMGAFRKECETHAAYMKAKLGISTPGITILVYVHRFVGMRLTRKGRVMRQYAKNETCYPLQLCCPINQLDLLVDPRYVERERAEHDTSVGAKVLYVGPEPKGPNEPVSARDANAAALAGAVGYVLESSLGEAGGAAAAGGNQMLSVMVRVHTQPLALPPSLVEFASPASWLSLSQVSERVRVSPLAVSMLCSSMTTSPQFGSVELGLCLKFTGKNLARVGYTKLVQQAYNPWYVGAPNIFEKMLEDPSATGHHLEQAAKGDFLGRSSANKSGRGTWFFSRAAVDLIAEYVRRFEPLVRRLEAGGANSAHLEPPQFLTGPWQSRDADEVVREIEAFVAASGVMAAPMVQAMDDTLTRAHLAELEAALDRATPRPAAEVVLRAVPRRYLYFPTMRVAGGGVMSVPLQREQRYSVGARVAYCRTTGAVPFGASGTIVRLLASGQEAEVVYDEPFTGGTHLGGRLRTPRGAITKLGALLITAAASGDADTGVSPVASPVTLGLRQASPAAAAAAASPSTAAPGSREDSFDLAAFARGLGRPGQQQQQPAAAARPAAAPAAAAASSKRAVSDKVDWKFTSGQERVRAADVVPMARKLFDRYLKEQLAASLAKK